MLKWFPMARLIFTDTDSLYYVIEAPDVEAKLFEHRDLLDYSDYPVGHKYHDPTNRLKLGKFKCETKGASIIEIVALRPKMYSIMMRKDADPASQTLEKQRIKGISQQLPGTFATKITSRSCMTRLRTIRSNAA